MEISYKHSKHSIKNIPIPEGKKKGKNHQQTPSGSTISLQKIPMMVGYQSPIQSNRIKSPCNSWVQSVEP